MPYLSYKVKIEQNGWDVKSVLMKKMQVSSSLISRVKLSERGILQNGVRVFTNAIVKTDDIIEFDITDAPSDKPVKMIEHPLNIVYEDEFLAVINKPAGMVVYAPNEVDGPTTLANALAFRYNNPYLNLHIVNRLDRGTTGLMVITKNGFCHEYLRRVMHTDEFIREYLAVTDGVPNPLNGEITLPIEREENSKIKRKISPSGAFAKTYYETISQTQSLALVKLRLETGRTHQIRLHMSAIGCPLTGDFLYGTENKNLISRPALHSYHIKFIHPVLQTEMEFTCDIPKDMKNLLK